MSKYYGINSKVSYVFEYFKSLGFEIQTMTNNKLEIEKPESKRLRFRSWVKSYRSYSFSPVRQFLDQLIYNNEKIKIDLYEGFGQNIITDFIVIKRKDCKILFVSINNSDAIKWLNTNSSFPSNIIKATNPYNNSNYGAYIIDYDNIVLDDLNDNYDFIIDETISIDGLSKVDCIKRINRDNMLDKILEK